MITSYRKSLEKSTQFKQIEQLSRILELIAMCKTIVRDEYEFSKNTYGVNKKGIVLTNDTILRRMEKYHAIGKRLQSYYNNKIDKVIKF
jgi:nicotinic acid mononucleotide adenylyltransferase